MMMLVRVLFVMFVLLCGSSSVTAQSAGQARREFFGRNDEIMRRSTASKNASNQRNATRADRIRDEAREKNMREKRLKELTEPNIEGLKAELIVLNEEQKEEEQLDASLLYRFASEWVKGHLNPILDFMDWSEEKENEIYDSIASVKARKNGGIQRTYSTNAQTSGSKTVVESDGNGQILGKSKTNTTQEADIQSTVTITEADKEKKDKEERALNIVKLKTLLRDCEDRVAEYERTSVNRAKVIVLKVTKDKEEQYRLNDYFLRALKGRLWDKDGLPRFPNGKPQELAKLIQVLQESSEK